MNHGRKFAFAFLLLSILMLPRFAAAQAKQPAILQIQNSGTTAGTAANYFKINFTTGCTTTFSNGVFSIACTGGAGNPGGSANQIQYNNAGTSFGAFTMTGDCSIVVATGVITCTASNGTPFASGAFAAAYSLPAATSSTLGGVKPDGTTLSNTSGAIAVNYTSTTYFPFQSITTTGTSGAATLSGGVLNIPQYPGSGLSGMTATQIPVAATASTITSSIATTNPTYFPFQSLTTIGSSGAATLSGGVLNIPQYSGGSGTVNAAPQYSYTYYSAAGTATTVSGFTQLTAGISTGINANGLLFSDLRYFNCASPQYTGATLDVTLNACWAAVITNLGGIANAQGINDASGLSESITSLVQTNQLLAPSLTKVSSGTGTAYGSSAVVTVSYAMTSPQGLSDASSEASITVDGTCPSSGNCFVRMASPVYPGTATTYTPYMATSTGYAGLSCGTVSIGSTQAFGQCAGSAVSKAANQTAIFLLPAKATWTCNLTGTDCLQAMDHSIWHGELAGSSGGLKIATSASTNLSDAIVGTDRNAKNAGGVLDGGQIYNALSGFQITGTNTSAVAPIGLRWSALADNSRLENIQVVNGVGIAGDIYATGYSFLHNTHFDCDNSLGTVGLVVGKSGANSSSIYADKLTLVHCATSLLQYAGGTTNLVIAQLDEEGTLSANPSNVLNDFGTQASQIGTVAIGLINIGSIGTGATSTIVKLESNMNQFDLGALGPGGQAGVTPISDLRSGAVTATPFTFTQCEVTGGALGPCGYHVRRTPDFYASGTQSLQTDFFGVASAPANPASGVCRLYFNTTTGLLAGINSSGGSCTPSGSGPGTGTQYDPAGWATTSTLGSIAPTSGYDAVPQVQTATTTSGAFTALPSFVPPGVVPNAQTGTTYTYLLTDRMKYVSFSNASSIAVTLPAAGGTGFGLNFVNVSCDIGAGTATITPTTSTISYSTGSAYTSAASTMALTTGQCAWIYSDNTNYFAIKFSGGSGGDTITSPNSTLAVGGTATNTTLDLVGSAGEIMAGATPALTYTPTLGKSGTAGTLAMFPASGNFTTTWGSAATASNTILGFATVPTNLHMAYCAVSTTVCTLTDTGYAYNAIPYADLTVTAANLGTTLNIAQYDEIYSNGTSAAPLGLAAPTTNGDWVTGYHITGSAASAPVNEELVASTTNSVGLTVTPTYNATGPTQRFEITGSSYTGNAGTATTAANLTGCTGSAAGDICIYNGSAWTRLAGNTGSTNYLSESSAGSPSWASPSGGGIAFPQTVSGTTTANTIPYLSNSTTLTGNQPLKTDSNSALYQSTYTGNNTTGSVTINPSNGPYQTITLTGNVTSISFTQPTLGSTIVRLKFTQAASGGPYTITWTAGAPKWPGGIAPVMTAAASGVDWYSCLLDGTNTWCTAGQNFQ